MGITDSFNQAPAIIIISTPILLIGVLHITIGFLRKEPDFNTYALFNSSLFYDFSLSDDICKDKEINIFHTWGGWKRYGSATVGKVTTITITITDVTDVTKINGKYFCHKTISYIDLLNNGQIIKNGTQCPEEYKKNCGRIDTLNQELCIKENDKCPLYDIEIGYPPNSNMYKNLKIYIPNYTYDKNSNIYYNNENYNDPNKTIKGKLILNDGQPCNDPTEKLWRSFSSLEAINTHLV